MSYDADIIKRVHKTNYTSNIYPIVDLAFKNLQNQGKAKDYYDHWTDQLKGPFGEKDYLRDLILELKSRPDLYEPLQPKIDPKTGERWGSYEGCIKWLEELLVNWKEDCELEITW